MPRQKTVDDGYADWPKAVELYHELLHHFYGREDRVKALPHALKLQRLLERLDPKAHSLPGNEYRAVIAELDDDTPAAVRYREAVVRMMKKWVDTERLAEFQVGPDEYADQLDLLALAYIRAERLDDARRTLARSRAVCEAAGVPFDGEDVEADLAAATKRVKRRKAAGQAK